MLTLIRQSLTLNNETNSSLYLFLEGKEEHQKIKLKDKIKAHFTKDKNKQETRVILATPENSEIVEDSPRFHRATNWIIPTDRDPIKEINMELHSISTEKNCTCQLDEAQVQTSDTLNTTPASVEHAPRKLSAGQGAGSSEGSCSSALDDRT